MTANTTHQIVCCACGAINRTPVGKPLTSGKCGKCAGPLAMAGPVDVAPRAVEKLLTRDTGVFVIDAWAPWWSGLKTEFSAAVAYLLRRPAA